MTENDIDAFFELLDDVFDLMGKTPAAKIISAGAKAMFFRAVAEHPLEEVRAALDHHASTGTFTPVPKDVNSYIEARRPVVWISADEAWGLIPKWNPPGKLATANGVTDDWRTAGWPLCLMNQATAEALKAAAPMMERKRPDEVAARMAFKGAYERAVEREKLARRPPLWFISGELGGDGRREDLQAEAARLAYRNVAGLPFSAPAAAPRLMGPSTEQRAKLAAALAGLKIKPVPTDEAE